MNQGDNRRTVVEPGVPKPPPPEFQAPGSPASAPLQTDVRETVYEPTAPIPGAPIPGASIPDTGTSSSAPSMPRPLGSADSQHEPSDTATDSTPTFRPSRRPATALLVILDDGSANQGEIVRIRKNVLTIGRTQGDLQIDNDPDISGTHVSLVRHLVNGRYRWRLQDENSTNGTFVRVTRAILADGKELILGSERYVVEGGGSSEAASEDSEDPRSTRVYDGAPTPLAKQLTLRTVSAPSRTVTASPSGTVLGRDKTACDASIDFDPYASDQHARITFTSDRWCVEDLGSTNGTWVRVRRLWLDRDAEFQIGEQRFRFIPNVSS